MHGPYTAKVTINRQELVLSHEDLLYGEQAANRFFQGQGIQVAVGVQRAASLFVAGMLEPGETAEVEVVGFDGTGTGRPAVWKRDTVRRDANGAAFLSLGSRFGERHFRGV